MGSNRMEANGIPWVLVKERLKMTEDRGQPIQNGTEEIRF